MQPANVSITQLLADGHTFVFLDKYLKHFYMYNRGN